MRLLSAVRTRFQHPTYVDHLYRARCECGWTGPVREDEWDAQDDRGAHWQCIKQAAFFGKDAGQ